MTCMMLFGVFNISIEYLLLCATCYAGDKRWLLLYHMCVSVQFSSVAQLCSTVCDPRDCSPPGSSVLGILQARILEWVAIPFSRGIFLTQGLNLSPESPALVGRFFTIVLPRKPNLSTRNLELIYPFITVAKVRCVYVFPVCIYQILKIIGVKGED